MMRVSYFGRASGRQPCWEPKRCPPVHNRCPWATLLHLITRISADPCVISGTTLPGFAREPSPAQPHPGQVALDFGDIANTHRPVGIPPGQVIAVRTERRRIRGGPD